MQLDELFRMRYHLLKLFEFQKTTPAGSKFSGVCISVKPSQIFLILVSFDAAR